MANEEAREALDFDVWFAARKDEIHAAGVAEGIRQAREADARLARSMIDNEPDGYYGQACSEVAAAIDALGEENGHE